MKKKLIVRSEVVMIRLIALLILAFNGKEEETSYTYGEVKRGD